jgi:hypothetical protein
MSTDAALYAVSAAVSASSLALVVASRIFERRAKRSVDRDESEPVPQSGRQGVVDEGTSEPDETLLKQTGEATQRESERAHVTVTPTSQRVLERMDKPSLAESQQILPI